MFLDDFIWRPSIVEKLKVKHRIEPEEVEQVFFNHPSFRKVEQGNRAGEDLYSALGQTDSGRYLIVFFIKKSHNTALIVSARDMDKSERRRHAKS